ncbi:hypothetical protein TSUD_123070 [Trifolium subterraneum]|uniref:RRM domain-containing protein n=2 Tax=Trifolium TaxID=3898 RepID=A0A2Z6MGI7_TRISU|nr:hypothetical protein TSUD_123070 [Trifolium subterraneum]
MTTRIAPGVGANLLGQHSAERNQDATAYVGNLDPQISEELLWELFVQAGPVVNVYVPKDRVTNQHQGYGFVEFRSEEDADYAIKVLNMIKLYGKPIRVNKASQDKKSLDVGANLFIGNLDPDVDEKLLYDTFSAFGVIVTNPKNDMIMAPFIMERRHHNNRKGDLATTISYYRVAYGASLSRVLQELDENFYNRVLKKAFLHLPEIMRDPDTGNSRGFGFISYDSFEASDSAIEAMNGQYLCNRQITVSYAYKKDTKGERHGTPAERVLAASNPTAQKSRPHTLFASGPPTLPNAPQANGTIAAPAPPRPFSNGVPPPIPVIHPPPPQAAAFQPMQMPPPGQQQWHQQQPGQQMMQQGMPPPPMQQFRPPHSMQMPPPPPQGMQGPPRPLPPPSVMAGQQQVWRPPPPPQQQGGHPMGYPQNSMPPPPPPNHHGMRPPSG